MITTRQYNEIAPQANNDKVHSMSTSFEKCMNCGMQRPVASKDSLIFFVLMCNECMRHVKLETIYEDMHPQSGFLSEAANADISRRFTGIHGWLYSGNNHGKSFLSEYFKIPCHLDRHINLLEDVMLFMHHISLCNTTMDRYIAVTTFSKLRGSRFGLTTSICYILSDFLGSSYMADPNDMDGFEKNFKMNIMEPQSGFFTSDDPSTNEFAKLRSYLTTFEKIKETTIYKKLYKVGLYMLTLGILDKVVDFESCAFSKFEAEAIKRTHGKGVGMVYTLVDTMLFICDRGVETFKSGRIDTFFESGASFEKWLRDAQRLKRQSQVLSNPEPHGIDRFAFTSELKSAIEKGRAISKFTVGLDKSEKLLVGKYLCDLQMIESELLTKKDSQKARKAPFAVLIHGASSIGKSTIKDILYYHYASAFGLPNDMTYQYTRSPTDEYWSGFDSSKWCIVMDDIAFMKPGCSEMDPTLAEMLLVVNNVPFCPPQAELENKGRTPVKSELVLATTNAKGLNLHAYFSCPYAVARRFPYVITPCVKDEYRKNGSFALDSSKIQPLINGEYADYWNFEISEPRPETDDGTKDHQQAKMVTTMHFTNIHDLLAWFGKAAAQHKEIQEVVLNSNNSMQNNAVCKTCFFLETRCVCAPIEIDEFSMQPQSAEIGGGYECPPLPEMLEEELEMQQCLDDVDATFVSRLKVWYVCKVVGGMPLELGYTDWFEYQLTQYYPHIILAFLGCLLFNGFLSFLMLLPILLHFSLKYIFVLLSNWHCYRGGYMWKEKFLIKYLKNEEAVHKYIFRTARRRCKAALQPPGIKSLVSVLTKVSAALGILYTVNKFKRKDKELKTVKKNCDKWFQGCYDHGLCGTRSFEGEKCFNLGTNPQSEGSAPTPMVEEKPVFYYHDQYAITGADLTTQSLTAQANILEDKVNRAIAHFWVSHDNLTWQTTTALNISGQLWMLNMHALKHRGILLEGEVYLKIVRDPIGQNINRNIVMRVHMSEFKFLPSADLACIELRQIQPGHDITSYFPKAPLKGRFAGTYHFINNQGVRSVLPVENLSPGRCHALQVPNYTGFVHMPTRLGQCGSPLIMTLGSARVIAGIHGAGDGQNTVSCVMVTSKEIDKLLHCFDRQIQGGTIFLDEPSAPKTLLSVHSKSPLRFVPQGCATVYGSLAGFRPQMKSKVQPTYIQEEMKKAGYPVKFGAPDMTWKPWNHAVNDMTAPNNIALQQDITKCGDAFFDDIMRGVGDQLHLLKKYDVETALNGAEGVTYVDRINTRTSAGHPFQRPKNDFLTFDEFNKIVELDDRIKIRMDKINAAYERGERFNPIFAGSLKDDPVKFKKIKEGKTRVFTGSEFAWSIVVRQHFLSFIRLMQNNPFVFESMPGLVAQSIQWQNLHDFLIAFGKKKMVAGDYKTFDKKMMALWIEEAFRIIIRLYRRAGADEADILAMQAIAKDVCFPIINLNGDVIGVQGNPSGHPLTVIINCIVNCLYIRYAFMKKANKPLKDFQKYVHLATYGDDNIMGISDEVEGFNHTSIAEAMLEIGVEYTMADKEAESVPFIDIGRCTFLKRSFVYVKEIGAVVAPLDHESIEKMLTVCVPSKSIAPQAHAIAVIETALREYFYYGKEVFEDRLKFFTDVIKEKQLQFWTRESTFPQFSVMRTEFWAKYGGKEPEQE